MNIVLQFSALLVLPESFMGEPTEMAGLRTLRQLLADAITTKGYTLEIHRGAQDIWIVTPKQ